MVVIYGYDTETRNGPPISQQIAGSGLKELFWVDGETIFSDFLDFLDTLPNNGNEYVFYALIR
jgi:hypothetical protein